MARSAAAEERGRALVEEQYKFLELGYYWEHPVPGFLAVCEEATGNLRLIEILSIEDKKARVGRAGARFMVETTEGLMLLSDETYVVVE